MGKTSVIKVKALKVREPSRYAVTTIARFSPLHIVTRESAQFKPVRDVPHSFLYHYEPLLRQNVFTDQN